MPHFFHEKFDFVEFAVLGREMNFWKCSKGDLGVCGLADLRSEETTHDDGAVAGIEALLIAIYFVKKNSTSKGRSATWQGVVHALHARAVAVVA